KVLSRERDRWSRCFCPGRTRLQFLWQYAHQKIDCGNRADRAARRSFASIGPRKGRYSVRKLIEKYGRKANMMKWKEQLNGDCPKRDAHSMHERCDLICPDLPKVL